MNWMIDGAHGDLYRRAMGHPQLIEARDEWELERNLHKRHATPRLLARIATAAAAFRRHAMGLAQSSTEALTHRTERSVS